MESVSSVDEDERSQALSGLLQSSLWLESRISYSCGVWLEVLATFSRSFLLLLVHYVYFNSQGYDRLMPQAQSTV